MAEFIAIAEHTEGGDFFAWQRLGRIRLAAIENRRLPLVERQAEASSLGRHQLEDRLGDRRVERLLSGGLRLIRRNALDPIRWTV
jgi:hypothetical protein